MQHAHGGDEKCIQSFDLKTWGESRPALGPTQTPIQRIPGALHPGIKYSVLFTHLHLMMRLWMHWQLRF